MSWQMELFSPDGPAPESTASHLGAPGVNFPDLGLDDLAHRERILANPGVLSTQLRRLEAAELPPEAVGQVWRWVMAMTITQGLAPNSTCARYVESVRRMLDWCQRHSLAWDRLTASDLDRWQRSLFIERANQAKWRLVQVQAMKSFHGFRHRIGLASENVAAPLKGPKIAKLLPRKYTTAQLRELFRAIDQKPRSDYQQLRDRALLLFLLATGGRREEVARLRLDQLELHNKRGTVRFFGKGAKERVLGIEGPVLDALRAWIHVRDERPAMDDVLFYGLSRARYGIALHPHAIEAIVRQRGKDAGLSAFGVHRFRVTYATQLYDDGIGMEEIRILLGHEKIETTRRYISIADRSTSVRLSSRRQHEALGTVPDGLPRWSQAKEGFRK